MRRLTALALLLAAMPLAAQRTQKPPLHGSHWMAITGKPMAATAGAMMFQKGGNAVDAAAAMLAATCTMWDTLSWGGETQALIYNPRTKQVIGLNALGVAPTGATAELYKSKGLSTPPEYGPLAAVTPGTPGGLMTMLAEYGTMSLKDVLAPAIQMADGYAIEAQAANAMEGQRRRFMEWPYSKTVMLPHLSNVATLASGVETAAGAAAATSVTPSHDIATSAPTTRTGRAAPYPGEIFHQPELAATLRKLVDAERRRSSPRTTASTKATSPRRSRAARRSREA
jgi:gamma-glutamyltranspeptidase/glutathione hydrolase